MVRESKRGVSILSALFFILLAIVSLKEHQSGRFVHQENLFFSMVEKQTTVISDTFFINIHQASYFTHKRQLLIRYLSAVVLSVLLIAFVTYRFYLPPIIRPPWYYKAKTYRRYFLCWQLGDNKADKESTSAPLFN